ncbi:MAG: glycoside hydrolase family 2 protein [Planctomycetota bacterium]|nr:MAG: glycoside hydrolase family 2 protein [Planctomycetota bacterium]
MPKISLNLTGEWQFKEYPLQARRMRDLDSADWLTTNVPCSIFDSLIEAGQIKRLEFNAYPEKFSFVSEKPWIYRKIFDVTPDLLNCNRVDLVFDGLDTIASIWLNGKLIGKANNMFIPFRFDVTQTLKLQKNCLLVKFEPAIQYAKKLMNRYSTFKQSDFLNPHRVYIRKAQYQFGWDWCPALAGCGIWRPLRLEGIKEAKLAEVFIRTIDCNTQYADIKITVKLETLKRKEFLCRVNLSCNEQTIEHNLTFSPAEDSQSTVIRIQKPYLWWPAGYGQQHLYQLDCQLISGDEVIEQTQKKTGVRIVKLNRSPDKQGEKFQFEINGQPIFAKGANWIPASLLAGSVTNNDYQKLLHAAAEANINMLRVWGGGYYEANEFYKLCDELGIMVWQDFMFACAYYPDRQWFLEKVKNEAGTIIKQLRNHPCIVLWCGNNEIDWMHYTGKLGRGKKFYGKRIYHQLLPQLVAELDPDRDYIPTTPYAPDNNLNDPNSGTIHQWDIWSGHQPLHQYLCQTENIPRFVTEFGLQSLPHIETIKNFCPTEKLRIGSYTIEKHNYQVDGNSRLYRYVGDLFGTAESLEQLVYLSQITQARAAKMYVEHLRAHNCRNSGVLFWQFNDCCPAISWSAIDATYQPKAIYYYAKRFFSNLLIAVVSEWKKPKASSLYTLKPLNVTVINDSNQPITATLSCRLIDLFGHVIDQVALPLAIAPFSISALPKLPKAIISPEYSDKSCLHFLMKQNGIKIAENLFFYLPDKYIDWPKVKITKRLSKITEKQWKLTLKSNAVAKDVQISTSVPAQFSDNFIDLIPPDGFEIKINFEQPFSAIEPLLKLCSLKSVFKTEL